MRWFAAESLGKFGLEARAAIPKLTELLQDPNGNVQDSAAEALKKIGVT